MSTTTDRNAQAETALRAAANATPRIQALIAAVAEAEVSAASAEIASDAAFLAAHGVPRATPVAGMRFAPQRLKPAADLALRAALQQSNTAASFARGSVEAAVKAECTARSFLMDAMRAKAIADGTYNA